MLMTDKLFFVHNIRDVQYKKHGITDARVMDQKAAKNQ